MLTKTELSELLSIDGNPDSPILSIYLDIDQSNMANLNRGFEVALKNLLAQCEKTIPAEAQKAFRDDVKKTMEFVLNYTPQKKTLVMFCDASAGYFWQRSIKVPIQSQCYWERRPYVRPLIEAHDEFERYGLILTDRAHARLFTIALGEIEENKEALAEADVKRFDATGSDRALSQATFQRNADEHAKSHLKNVAALMERLAEEHRFDRLILAGPKEAVAKLQELLSLQLQKRVIGTLSLPMIAKDQEILDAANEFVTTFERNEEKLTVNKLITAAAKQQQAVVGLSPTVEAAVEGRIMSLVYSDDLPEDSPEWHEGKSRYCEIQEASRAKADADVESPNDLMEWLVARVARDGGHVEHVRDGAAEMLVKDAKGIGAFLRF